MTASIQRSLFYISITILVSVALLGCRDQNQQHDNQTTASKKKTIVEAQLDRDTWQRPNKVIELLGDLTDKTVADIGSGTGFFTFRLAFEAARVLAIDIDPDMIALVNTLKANLPSQYDQKIEARLVKSSSPGLKKDEIDHALIINTIAYFEDHKDYLSKIKASLKQGGKLVIVDFKSGYLPITSPPETEKISPSEVKKHLLDAGFVDITVDDTTLDYQYIVVGSRSATN